MHATNRTEWNKSFISLISAKEMRAGKTLPHGGLTYVPGDVGFEAFDRLVQNYYPGWVFHDGNFGGLREQMRRGEGLEVGPGAEYFEGGVAVDHVDVVYERFQGVDPGHAQAQTRLAQIDLSRGDYARALDHADAAWAAGHQDARTRLTLGDALVAEGRVDEGAEIVRGLPRAEARLETWGYYRHTLNGEYRRAADAFRAVVLLNPDNEGAARYLQQAEERARGY